MKTSKIRRLKSFLRKLFCNHEWEDESRFRFGKPVLCSDGSEYTRHVVHCYKRCKKCYKIKKLKVSDLGLNINKRTSTIDLTEIIKKVEEILNKDTDWIKHLDAHYDMHYIYYLNGRTNAFSEVIYMLKSYNGEINEKNDQ